VKFDPRIKVQHHETVYPPSEDTMLLLEAVEVRLGERVLEIGTGTGIIALHASRIGNVVATDVNPFAVSLARENARSNGLCMSVVRLDMFEGLKGEFGAVIFNPPYLREVVKNDWRQRAWQGGADGGILIARFLDGLSSHLKPDGRAFILVPTDLHDVLESAKERFAVRELKSMRLFFEQLAVLELRLPEPCNGKYRGEG